MAIGQNLPEPELGWKRIMFPTPEVSCTGDAFGRRLHDIGSSLRFNFTKSKIRIITSGNSVGLKLTIDGVSTHNQAGMGFSTITFEQLNLPSPIDHRCVVEVTSNPNNNVADVTCIDVEEGAVILPYTSSSGKIANSVGVMQIGDRIPFRYKATSNSFGDISELGTSTVPEIPAASSANPDGTAYFYHTGYDLQGKMKLEADRNIQHSISWDALNSAGIASGNGLPITDGRNVYTLRLPSGGVDISDKDNEWDKIIAEGNMSNTITVGDEYIWKYGICSWTSTCDISGGIRARGYTANGSTAASPNTIHTNYGFRPILLVEVKSVNVTIDNVNPTHMYKNNTTCTIKATASTEVLGATCQIKLSLNSVDLSSYGNDLPIILYSSLKYGSNNVTVYAKDSEGNENSISFTIIKEENYRQRVERTFNSFDGGYSII